MRLLIANRSEVAARIAKTAQRMGIETIGIYANDEIDAHHGRFFDHLFALPGAGATAYLDIEAMLGIATVAAVDLIHPGYGFLSEHALAAERFREAGLTWVGPSPRVIALMGNKPAAIALAKQLGIATVDGLDNTRDPKALDDLLTAAKLAFGGAAKVLLKAQAGGGGRGIRAVTETEQFSTLIQQASKEAMASFGNGELYAEVEIPEVRHIEVQFIGDGQRIWILGDRDCSLQRRRQKFLELAPAPCLVEKTRNDLYQAAARLAQQIAYRGVGTAEFIVKGESWWFIEVNARLQVEHTVTEAITGLDLVALQLKLAIQDAAPQASAWQNPIAVELERFPRLDTLNGKIKPACVPHHSLALQCRILAESYEAAFGNDHPGWRVRPSAGTVSAWKPPVGAGLRVDHALTEGDVVTSGFDTMIAKLIVSVPCATEREDWQRLFSKATGALTGFQIEGLATNIPWLLAILRSFQTSDTEHPWAMLTTQWFDQWLKQALANHGMATPGRDRQQGLMIEQVHATHGANDDESLAEASKDVIIIYAPIDGCILELIKVGTRVTKADELGLIESMKMHHALEAGFTLRVTAWFVTEGSQVVAGQKIGEAIPIDRVINRSEHKFLSAATESASADEPSNTPALAEHPRMLEWRAREAMTSDAARSNAVAKRHASGMQTARENLAQLLDRDSFHEIGSLVVAAQRKRRSLDDLIQNTPADGVITGLGKIHSDRFPEQCNVAVIAYDYTVLAGTQGKLNHDKQDRLLELCSRSNLPLILLAEGGGGRPGDVDVITAGSLHIKTFSRFASLSGQVPVVGIVAGRCFAGNAVLLGCCDVIIATRQSNIGMAGPAMIEGGGLGRFPPEAIGPSDIQQANGVIDVITNDEKDAIVIAKRYLSYFQGIDSTWGCPNPNALAHALPLDRLRVYDMHRVIERLIDIESGLELRPTFAPNIITMLARLEGRPVGLLANNPMHLGGAIDANAADKAARFVQLCNAHGLAIVSLIDTPGNMVGPQAEAQALVRHCCRLFLAGAKVQVPWISLVIRKAYGLGAMAMAGGSFHDSLLSVAWPQAEFGGMGLEGAVRLGFKRELEAMPDETERAIQFQERLHELMEQGKAISAAMLFEIDAVIDPARSREWLIRALDIAASGDRGDAQARNTTKAAKVFRYVDAW